MLLITGSTGNTGLRVLEYINETKKYNKVKGFVRKESNIELHKAFDIELSYSYGDLDNIDDIVNALKDVETVIHIANIRYSKNVIKACEIAGVNRIIMVHTTGKYSKFRDCAEEYIEIEDDILNHCNINYTILRPTMIYGNSMDKNIHKLFRFLNKSKVMPVFGSSDSLLQPIYVKDLAMACVDVIDNPRCYRNDYDLSGGTIIKYNDLINHICRLLNKKIYQLRIPIKFAILLTNVYNFIMPKPIIRVEQVRRLTENKSYSHKKATCDFGFNPISINEGLKLEHKNLKDNNLI